jgi:hypothetical protein
LTKAEFKNRLKRIELSQTEFFRKINTSKKVGGNRKDDEEMPDIYEGVLELFEELYLLKNRTVDDLSNVELLKQSNRIIEACLKKIEDCSG